MSFDKDTSPAAGISMASHRGPVFAQSSISPVSAHSVSMRAHHGFSPTRREPAESNPARELSQPGTHADLKTPPGICVQRKPPYEVSEFFVQDRARPAADELRVPTGGDKGKRVTPTFQRFGYQNGSRPQREKQFSPGSGKSQPSVASTH